LPAKSYRAIYKAGGQCVDCPRKAENGATRCARCTKKNRERAKVSAANRRERIYPPRRLKRVYANQAGNDVPILYGRMSLADGDRDDDEQLVLVEYRVVRVVKQARQEAGTR
jgi:hypothetical protein